MGQKTDCARALDVYWCENLAGRLMQDSAGALSFAYDADFLNAAQTGISVSLPLREGVFTGNDVKAFFSGLLPDEAVRMRLAKSLGVSDENPFALLKAVGGDCAGALSLYPEGEEPAAESLDNAEILDNARLREILAAIKRRPFLAGGDMRLSLAGAQDKLAVGFERGHILLMKGGQPTTHILKPVIEGVQDSAYNELFCMRLASAIGINAPFADIHFADDAPYYLVERYDRARQADGSVRRIHQEDFCQALGILPELKYEREGGPNIDSCSGLIANCSAQPAADWRRFLEIVIFNYLIGNNDAHGKNFSLLYRDGKPELAPAYDLLSTAIYPDLSPKMAMKIGGKYDADAIFLRHWLRLAPGTKSAQSAMKKQLQAIAGKTVKNARLLQEKLEAAGLHSPVYADICGLISKRAARLTSQDRA